LSESTEQWAWRQGIQGNLKIVLYWLAHREVDGVCHEGSTMIARYAGLPTRTVERAFQQLDSMGLISRPQRGQVVVKPVTGDGSPRQERRVLARGRSSPSPSTATVEHQPELLKTSEWADAIFSAAWVKIPLTPQEVANTEKNYPGIDWLDEALKWRSFHNDKKRKPKGAYRSFGNWLKREKLNGTGSTATTVGSSAISSRHEFSGDRRPRSAGLPFDT